MADTKNRVGNARRECRPFMEKHGRQHKWRRIVPQDIRKTLGIEAWVYIFPAGTADEVLDASSLALAKQTDDLIEVTRAKLAYLKAARTLREAGVVLRA